MGVQKIYLNESVLAAAKDRIRWLFSEFQTIYVSFSGGKDSTVCLNLTLAIAEELGRLPVNVMFIDQEAEWQTVIDYVKTVMYDPRVKPFWLQIPFRIFNASSPTEPWLKAWEPGKEWIRDKDPIARTRNVYGTDRFKELFGAFALYHHPTKPCASIAGVRCEESPGRTLGLTVGETYKGVTWAGCNNARRKHFVFYPIYDWTYRDVWKAIHDHNWPYTKLYDLMWQYGVKVRNMRVSNVHHESAMQSLFYLQELEADTWDKVTKRLRGVATVGQMRADFCQPTKLPFMFTDWVEYRDYLLDNLIPDPKEQESFRHQFALLDPQYSGSEFELLVHTEIAAVLANDTYNTLLGQFTASMMSDKRKARQAARQVAELAPVEDQP